MEQSTKDEIKGSVHEAEGCGQRESGSGHQPSPPDCRRQK